MSDLLYMIINDLSIHLVPYVRKPCDHTITNIQISWVGFHRGDFEILDDTMFDMIGQVFV